MRTLLFAAILLGLPAPGQAQGSSEPGCPPTAAAGQSRVHDLLSLPYLAESSVNMGSASGDSVVPLDGEENLATCRTMWSAVNAQARRARGYYSFAFYQSGDRYFVVLTPPPPPPGKVMLRHVHAIEVYDQDFQFLARFGM